MSWHTNHNIMAVPFFTGKVLAEEAVTGIAPGTAVAAFTADEQNAKVRRWSLTTAASAALLPYNPYRASIQIDNVLGGAEVKMYVGDSASDTQRVFTIPSATGQIFEVHHGQIGTGQMVIGLSADDSPGATITERSYA